MRVRLPVALTLVRMRVRAEGLGVRAAMAGGWEGLRSLLP